MLNLNYQVFEGEYAAFQQRAGNGLCFEQLKFSIMHGNGNVLAVVDEALSGLSAKDINGTFAKEICGSFHSIRIDGISFLRRISGKVKMTYYERDGTHSQMCGNALRCSALYCYEQGYIAREDAIITDDGEKWVSIALDSLRVGLGVGREFQKIAEEQYFAFSGLPHVVVFVDELECIDVKTVGAALRYDKQLCELVNHPEGVHVDFLKEGPDYISIRTYEVGVEDETLACGTGVAASAFIANRVGLFPLPIHVKTKGGEMTVDENEHGLIISGVIEYLFSNIKTEITLAQARVRTPPISLIVS
jgi:diaminopimelate epimerase